MKNKQTTAKKRSLLAIALAVIIGFSFAACGGGGGGGDDTTTYTGVDSSGATYELVIAKSSGKQSSNKGGNDNKGGSGSSALNGTWVMEEGGEVYTWVFNNGNYVLSYDGSEWRKGTYTIKGSNISIATTHIKGWVLAGESEYETQFGPNIKPDQWYTKQDLYNFWLNAAYAESKEKGQNFTKAEIDKQIGGVVNKILDSSFFKLMEGKYKLSGNTLVITSKDDDEDTITFTRQGRSVSADENLSVPDGRAANHKKGDEYTLTIKNGSVTKTSSGYVVSVKGYDITVENIDGGEFTITVSNKGGITLFTGTIYLDNGDTYENPGALTNGGNTGGGDTGGGGGSGSWTAVSNSTFGTTRINAIAYGGNRWVAGGDNGKMAYSTNGANWTAVSNSTFGTDYIYAIAYGNNRFVAVGDSKMAYSADGITWTAIEVPTFSDTGLSNPYASQEICGIAYGGSRFVIWGYHGGMAYSTDGVKWTESNNRQNFNSYNISSRSVIAYGNGTFVTGIKSGWAMAYSTNNGESWTLTENETFNALYPVEAIVYGGTRFVAVGGRGQMGYSTNGAAWTVVSNSTFGQDDDISAVAYGGSRFVAGGEDGKTAYSSDGVTWTAGEKNVLGTVTNSGFTTGNQINAIAYGGGRFVAGGEGGKMAYRD